MPPPVAGDNDTCQVCKVNKYIKPDLVLRVTECFHKICEDCVKRLFRFGNVPCPVCSKPIKKINLSDPTYEDLFVEREVRVRQRICVIYNKRREDFKDLRAYNDYLEEIEDIVFNIVNEVDTKETEEKIDRYRRENQEVITRNMSKMQQDSENLKEYIRLERQQKQANREAYLQHQAQEETMRRSEQESLINELASSQKSAQSIVQHHVQTNIRARGGMPAYSSLVASHTWTMHEPGAEEVNLPDVDPLETLYHDDDERYTQLSEYFDPHMGSFGQDKMALGGGFRLDVTYARSLESLFRGVLLEAKR
ncbi:TFIIH/NER complex subunit [Sorochytrium milnesiophthora]